MGAFIRDFLDGILTFCGAASLSDLEFASIDLDVQAYNLATYEALLGIINARELVSNTSDRLRYFFLARGLEVSAPSQANSNIYIGDVL